MKKVLFLFIVCGLIVVSCKTTQDPLVKAEEQARYQMAVQALKDSAFVLEADRIDFKSGRFTYVSGSTNFISMHGNKVTIQMAFNSPYAGPNGIGGITVDGTASNVELKTGKKGDMNLTMMVQGAVVSAQVIINMQQGTYQCTATVTGNFSGNRISFTGYLYPESESNVYKGRSI